MTSPTGRAHTDPSHDQVPAVWAGAPIEPFAQDDGQPQCQSATFANSDGWTGEPTGELDPGVRAVHRRAHRRQNQHQSRQGCHVQQGRQGPQELR